MVGEQEKLNRLLKIISILKEPHGRSIKSMAAQLEVSERTIYRYLDLLEMNGFAIDKSLTSDRWFIFSENHNETDLLQFSSDEASLIKDLVETGAYNHPLKDAICQKLYINSEIKPLTKNIIVPRLGGIVTKLKRAVKGEYRVVLKSYHSVSSNAIRDYFIEPHSFGANYLAVFAYDIKAKKNKQFRTCRIGDVQEYTKNKQCHQNQHQKFVLDPFGYNGEDKIEITLRLNHASVTRMREDYPNTYPFLTKHGDDYYIFNGFISHLDGVGRFVLSQIDNVKIIKGASLINYVSEKLNAFNGQLRTKRILPGVTQEALLA